MKVLSFWMVLCSVFTPYYEEDVIYSPKQLAEENNDGISMMYYLRTIVPGLFPQLLIQFGISLISFWWSRFCTGTVFYCLRFSLELISGEVHVCFRLVSTKDLRSHICSGSRCHQVARCSMFIVTWLSACIFRWVGQFSGTNFSEEGRAWSSEGAFEDDLPKGI